MTHQVVGCSTCSGFWIVEDLRTNETAECPLCFTQHQTKRLNVRFAHDDFEVAAEVRSKILAEKADHREQYEVEDDYGQLADRVENQPRGREEFLEAEAERCFERFDTAFEKELEEYWARSEDRRLEDAACNTFEQFDTAFEDELDAYLERSQDRRLEAEAEAYLDRREWPSNVEAGDFGTPGDFIVTHQKPAHAVASIRVDKSVSDISRTLLDHQPVQETLVATIRDVASDRTAVDLYAVFDDADIDIPGRDLAGLAQSIARGDEQAVWTLITRLRTTGRGRSSTEDTFVVPRLLALSDETPTFAMRIVEEFWDLRRSQREDVCEYLSVLARGCDVRLVGTGLQHWRLYKDHRADLPVSRDDITPRDSSPASERITKAKEVLEPGSPEVQVLRWLADEDSQTLSYSALDSRLTVSGQRRSHYLHDDEKGVVTLGLADDFGPRTRKHVELLPAGRQYLDWLDTEIARQQTLAESVSDVCNASDDSRVSKRAHVRGEDGGRQRLPPLHTTQLLPRWDAAATAASTPEHGLAVVDYPLQEQSDRGSPRWHYDESADRLVVGAECDGPLQYWVCVARALASQRTFGDVLGEGDRIDETEDLAEFLQDHKALLRDLVCMGYLPDDVEDGADYLDELQSAEAHLCELTENLAADDFEGTESEYRSVITREALGLAKTMLDLLDQCGVDVVQQVRLPRQNEGRNDMLKKERRLTLVESVVTAVKIYARAGLSSVYRQLFEDDENRREAAIEPSVDAFDVAELVGSICIVGDLGTAEDDLVAELRGHLGRLDEDVHEDAPRLSVRVPVEATDDLPRQRYGRAVERMAAGKNLRATREAVSLLRLFTATPFDAARAIAGLRSEDDPRDLRVSEVRTALAQLDESRILPWETRGVSSITAALLAADQPLSGSEIVDRAGVSRGTWQNHRDWLIAVGLVTDCEQGYRLMLAFNTDEERYHDEMRPWYVKSGDDAELPFVVAVRSLGTNLATRLLAEEEQGEAVQSLLAGPPDPERVIRRWPRLGPWLRVLCAVCAGEEESPEVVVFGRCEQESLQAAASGGASA